MEKKTYKESPKIYLGSSDIAALTLQGISSETDELTPQNLFFGMDEDYYAYLLEEDVEPGHHYQLKASYAHWVNVSDDTGRTVSIRADKIEFYRAGEMGCVVKVYGKKNIKLCE